MTPAALKALKESIAHWERLVKITPHNEEDIESPYANDCPLCHAFLKTPKNIMYHRPCFDCPVMQKTGNPFCGNTPWKKAEQAWSIAYLAPTALAQKALRKWQKAARAELQFLKSLLPKAEKV